MIGFCSFDGLLDPTLLFSISIVRGFGGNIYGGNLTFGKPFRVNISFMFFWNIPMFIDSKWCTHDRIVTMTAMGLLGVVEC